MLKRFMMQLNSGIIRPASLLFGMMLASDAIAREGQSSPVEIAMWGDSLTQGKGASGPERSYPAQACALIGACIAHNRGWGGQGSTRIATRQGALPLNIILRDGLIPESPMPVAVMPHALDVLQIGGRPAGSLPGTLAGIHGMLQTDAQGAWSFLRSTSGFPLTAAGPVSFVPDDAQQLQQAETWIWVGRNNLRMPDIVLRDIAMMVAHLGHDRFLVGEILPSAKDSPERLTALAGLNAELARRYGPHFVPLLLPLQTMAMTSDAADIARGIVPASLRSDYIHLNDGGYSIVASQFVAAWRAR